MQHVTSNILITKYHSFCHGIAEILLKVALNTIKQTNILSFLTVIYYLFTDTDTSEEPKTTDSTNKDEL